MSIYIKEMGSRFQTLMVILQCISVYMYLNMHIFLGK